MSSPYDQAIEQMMAEYHRQLDQINENHRQIQEITATATSQRKSVSVTLDAQGQLTELKFLTDAYKQMSPIELANVITETFAAARDQVSQQLAEAMQANVPEGLDMSALFGPDSDLGKVLPRDPVMSEQVREYVDNGNMTPPTDSKQ